MEPVALQRESASLVPGLPCAFTFHVSKYPGAIIRDPKVHNARAHWKYLHPHSQPAHTLALINLLKPNPLSFLLLFGRGLPCLDPASDAGDASRCLRLDSELPVEVRVSLRFLNLRMGVGDEVRCA